MSGIDLICPHCRGDRKRRDSLCSKCQQIENLTIERDALTGWRKWLRSTSNGSALSVAYGIYGFQKRN
jgi:hypothetical protein